MEGKRDIDVSEMDLVEEFEALDEMANDVDLGAAFLGLGSGRDGGGLEASIGE